MILYKIYNEIFILVCYFEFYSAQILKGINILILRKNPNYDSK